MAVQPVAIQYLRAGQIDPIAPFIGDDDLVSHLMRLFAQPRGEVCIQLLQPIGSVGKERAVLALQAQQAIHWRCSGLKTLSWRHGGRRGQPEFLHCQYRPLRG